MQTRIYTSYFHNIENTVNPVSIARNEPKWFKHSQLFQSYKRIAPSWSLLGKAKSGKINFSEYVQLYHTSVLEHLSPIEVLAELNALFGQEMTLLCWEKNCFICHRRLFAKWLMKSIDLYIPESATG